MPTGPNLILTATNGTLEVTNLTAIGGRIAGLSGLPLGTPNDSATGPIAVKVIGTGTGGSVPVTPTAQTVTPTTGTMAASSSFTIPAGSKGWTFTVLSGTGGIGGVTGLPVGFSDSDPNTLAAGLTVTTAAASTAYYRYNT
jgi:hypothetical protein